MALNKNQEKQIRDYLKIIYNLRMFFGIIISLLSLFIALYISTYIDIYKTYNNLTPVENFILVVGKIVFVVVLTLVIAIFGFIILPNKEGEP